MIGYENLPSVKSSQNPLFAEYYQSQVHNTDNSVSMMRTKLHPEAYREAFYEKEARVAASCCFVPDWTGG